MGAKIICFGEVLFDVFPTHTKIGGAPLNVSLRLASLGIETEIISRIGLDEKGKELLYFIESNNVSTAYIQRDSQLSTGEVTVYLDERGSASYTINYPVAWDKIEATAEEQKVVATAEAFVFGSLASRDDTSYQSLLNLLNFAKYKVFDVNLRTPFYTKELLLNLMNKADFIKFNDDELYEISEYLESPFYSLEQNMQFIAEKTNTQHICVTKGKHGAVLLYNNQLFYNSGYKIIVSDTVGAGDSFLAGLLSKLLTGVSPQKAINFACALGALVAQHEGANPTISTEDIAAFIQ